MELLKELVMTTLSNLVWVVLVFGVLYFWDKKKKEQQQLCMGAYLIFLFKSTGVVKNHIYPYVHLVKLKSAEGTILSHLLNSIYSLTTNILTQTQEILTMVESRTLQEKILKLYHLVILFQSQVAQSQVQANIIVGNPTELVEGERGEEEMKIFRTFAQSFQSQVKDLYQVYPPSITNSIPSEILQLLNQKTPLEENIENS